MGNRLDFVQRSNAGYLEEQYARYRRDPASVSEEWALFFAGFDLAEDRDRAPGAGAAHSGSEGAFGLVNAYRHFGHLVARLDPLGLNETQHPLLDLSQFRLTEADLQAPLGAHPFKGEVRGTLGDLLAAL